MTTNQNYQDSESHYDPKSAAKCWIPVYGALKVASTFGKGAPIFHDTPPNMSEGSRAARCLAWSAYQAISLLATLHATQIVASGLEKILK